MLAVGIALSSQTVFAEKKQSAKIFKCTNSKNEVFYNEKPCPINDVEKKIRAVKDPKGLVANGNNYSETLPSLQEEEQQVASIEKEIAIYEKELAKKGSSTKDKKSKQEEAPEEAKAKESVATSKMTGAQRENYYERTTAEQKRITKEGEAGQNK